MVHLYWARRPIAAARAVLFAQLVDDPSSRPDEFPTVEAAQDAERARLHALLEKLVVWENSNDEKLLAQAREEIRKSNNGQLPAVLDPFAGGGAIPLKRNASASKPTPATSTRSPCSSTRPSSKYHPSSQARHPSSRCRRHSDRMGSCRSGSPKMSAVTANGCVTKPKPGSATSTRK